MTKNYVVIIGVGRSGTSLLHSLLASHSEIHAVPETAILRRHILRRRVFFQRSKVFLNKLQKDQRLKRLKLQKFKWARQKWYSTKYSRFRLYLDLIFFNISAEERFVCDKDPNLINVLHRVPFKLQPRLVIETVRDPRDVVVSKMHADWSSDKPLFYHIAVQYLQVLKSQNLEKIYGNHKLTIRYEDLIQSPSSTLKRICDRLDIDFEETMLDHEESASKLVFSDEMQWKRKILDPIDPANSNKWPNEITNTNLITIELLFNDYFKKYGYCQTCEYEKLRLLGRIKMTTKVSFLKLLISIIYKLKIA